MSPARWNPVPARRSPSTARIPAPATGTHVHDGLPHRPENGGRWKRTTSRSCWSSESLPKPINFTGGMEPLSYGGTFTLERILGTVPVEADGSAYFEVPAMRSVFFIALDGSDRAVKRMQSFTGVQPGESLGCIGCHEQRTSAPPSGDRPAPLALRRAPRRHPAGPGHAGRLRFPARHPADPRSPLRRPATTPTAPMAASFSPAIMARSIHTAISPSPLPASLPTEGTARRATTRPTRLAADRRRSCACWKADITA